MDVTGNKFQHQSSTAKRVELQYLRVITKQFSEDQILGNGGFGTVYKGEKEDGEVVAVKKLFPILGMDDKQFLSEVKHLVDVCHPNIVRLEGYCHHTEKELTLHNGSLVLADEVYRLLCFEYLPNGSLDKHLTDESSGLDWHKRYNIIEGICKGLHYLHEGRRGEPILHLDLKPRNILLDKNMVPKIADFGLSRLFGEEKTHTCTMNLRGTFGYMPPEYVEKGMISKESDIYSLGVIIIEIVTGHRKYPDDDDATTQEFIEVPEKWRRRLQTTSNYTSLEEDRRQVNKCVEVGLKCMERKPKNRPNIREIIEMLNGSENTNSCSVREDGQCTLKMLRRGGYSWTTAGLFLDVGGASSGRRRLRRTVLVVLFLIRVRTRCRLRAAARRRLRRTVHVVLFLIRVRTGCIKSYSPFELKRARGWTRLKYHIMGWPNHSRGWALVKYHIGWPNHS